MRTRRTRLIGVTVFAVVLLLALVAGLLIVSPATVVGWFGDGPDRPDRSRGLVIAERDADTRLTGRDEDRDATGDDSDDGPRPADSAGTDPSLATDDATRSADGADAAPDDGSPGGVQVNPGDARASGRRRGGGGGVVRRDGPRFDNGGRAFDPAFPTGTVEPVAEVAPTDETDDASHGLRADYFDFARVTLDGFPTLDHLTPSHTRVEGCPAYANDAAFRLPFAPDAFAARYAGRLRVDVPGRYEFQVTTNGGARLTLDHALVVRKDHDVNAPHGTADLTAGTHDLTLEVYDNYGDTLLTLYWRTPESAEWSVIPLERLTPRVVGQPQQPVIERIEPGYLQSKRRAILHGLHFADVSTFNRVEFISRDGREVHTADVRYAAVDRLVVAVPDVAGEYDLRVTHESDPQRDRATPVAVTVVEAAFGLLGSYHRIGETMTAMPDIDGRNAELLRIDPWINFNSEHSFKLPFPAQQFAARWEGFVEIPEPGTHTFWFQASTNSAGATVTFNGVSQPTDRPVELTLDAGRYPVRVDWYYNQSYPLLRLLEYPGPANEVPETWWTRGSPERNGTAALPSEFLWPPDHFRTADQPRLHGITPDALRVGRTFEIHGRGFDPTPGATTVHFRTIAVGAGGQTNTGEEHAEAEIIDVTDDRIVARVPPLPADGEYQVTVAVRNLWSNGSQVTITQDLGLVGEYVGLLPPVDAPFDWTNGGENGGDQIPFVDSIDLEMPRVDGAPEFLGPGPFAARWRGVFWAHVSGEYKVVFETNAAIEVWHDGKVYFEKPFTATPLRAEGYIEMDAGLYPFDLKATFADDREAWLRMYIAPPGAYEREIQLTDALPPEDYERRTRPEVQALSPDPVVPGGTVRLTVAHADGVRHLVVFPVGTGSEAREVVADRDGTTLTVPVPADVRPGQLTVIVDRYRSAPVLLQVETGSPNGLTGHYFRLTNETIYTFPDDIDARTPVMIRRDATVDFADDASFALPFNPENFLVVWEGQIRIAAPGEYAFLLGSDDGSRLFINGVRVLDNDGVHAYEEVEGRIALEPGLHRVRIEFFENFGGANCRFWWRKPGTGEKTIVPAANLFPPGYVPQPAEENK